MRGGIRFIGVRNFVLGKVIPGDDFCYYFELTDFGVFVVVEYLIWDRKFSGFRNLNRRILFQSFVGFR